MKEIAKVMRFVAGQLVPVSSNLLVELSGENKEEKLKLCDLWQGNFAYFIQYATPPSGDNKRNSKSYAIFGRAT